MAGDTLGVPSQYALPGMMCTERKPHPAGGRGR